MELYNIENPPALPAAVLGSANNACSRLFIHQNIIKTSKSQNRLLMKNSALMRSINTLYFRQNNSLILKLTSGQRKKILKHPRKLFDNYF
jgi:hypothetical protein